MHPQEQVKHYEEILYQSDPFLIESLYSKTEDELNEMRLLMYKRLDKVNPEAHSTIKSLKSTLETLEAYIALKNLAANDVGGISIV